MLTAEDYERLVEAVARLASCRSIHEVHGVLRDEVRPLTGADGVTIVVREGRGHVRYVDENAVGPLFKGDVFPVDRCLSGWVMTHGRAAVVPDIEQDARIPIDVYRRTFVRSVVMTPIGSDGAFGAYFRTVNGPTAREIAILERLARAANGALGAIEQSRALEAELRSRDALLATAAHELRNAVNGIVLRVASLRAATARAEPMLHDGMKKLERLVGHTAQLLGSLLDVARMNAGRLELTYESLDVAALVYAAVDRLDDESRAMTTPITVTGERSALADCDGMRVDEIVTNLVRNAIRYAPHSPVNVEVLGDDGHIEIVVRDAGPGLPEHVQGHIFEPFSAGPASGGTRGVGLGLWIVKRLVDAHRGTITVDSAPGEGTTFRVRFPRWLGDVRS